MHIKIRTCGALLVILTAAARLAAQSADEKIDPALLAALTAPNASAPFFVVLKDRADLIAASRIGDRAARARAVIQALQSTAFSSQAAARALLTNQRVPFTAYWVQNLIFVPRGSLALARALAQRPEVESLRPEPVFAIPAVVSAEAIPAQGVEWNIAKIRADQVWPVTRGAGIVVSNIDTGVRYTHKALVRQYRGNLGGSFSHKGNWNDPTGRCGGAPCDNTSHGTHVMGTIVGDDGVSNHIGVAPDAKWIACKGCADNSACYGSHLMSCAQWIMDPYGDGSGSGQPDVVNNSWAGASGNTWFLSFVDNWRAAGIFPAFAAGNSGPACGTAGSPADYPQAFAGGSTDSADVISWSSARGPSILMGVKPNVTAPGVGIRSSTALMDDIYEYFSGTSMASPHVAGTVALVWAAQPSLRGKVSLTEQLLQDAAAKLSTTEDCGGTALQVPNNTYGHGRLDAFAAAATVPAPNEPPVVRITSPASGAVFRCPANVSFSGEASDLENGNLTSGISWYDKGASFGSGGAVSKTFACTEAGLHNIVAGVTDSGRLSDADIISINIRSCLPKGAACTANSQCCSNRCAWGSGARVCR